MLYCGKTKKLPFEPDGYFLSLLFISDGHIANSGQLKIIMKSPQVSPTTPHSLAEHELQVEKRKICAAMRKVFGICCIFRQEGVHICGKVGFIKVNQSHFS